MLIRNDLLHTSPEKPASSLTLKQNVDRWSYEFLFASENVHLLCVTY